MKKRSDTMEFIPCFGVIGAIILGIWGLLDGVQFFLVLVTCLIVGAIAYGVLFLICIGLSVPLIKYPVKELQEAKDNEDSVRKRVDAVYITLKKHEREIELWNKRRNYMNENKEEIVSTLFERKSRNISSYIDEKLGIRNFS